jgi:hypothetical protein
VPEVRCNGSKNCRDQITYFCQCRSKGADEVRLLTIALAVLFLATAAWAKEAGPEQAGSQDAPVPKPVVTMTIKRCPEGYEPVTRYNGQHACAKDSH